MAALERVARLSGPLAEVLERGRERFNARFAQAAMFNRRLDAAQWTEHLITVVDPLVQSIALVDADQVETVTEVLYDLSLELLGSDLFARHLVIRKAWVEILPKMPGLLAAAPRRLVSAISNAAYNLAREQPAAAGSWLDDMLTIAPLCEQPEIFLDAGKVLAWRCGLAHYRESAISAWLSLPEELAAQVLPEIATAEDWDAVADELRRPWVRQPSDAGERDLNLVMRVGAFRGFGGQFISPPQVATDLSQLYVHDRQAWWTLHADRYGSTLKRLGTARPEGLVKQSGKFCLGDNQIVRWKSIAVQFSALSEAASMACNGDTLALSLPHSHHVYLVARGTALLALEAP